MRRTSRESRTTVASSGPSLRGVTLARPLVRECAEGDAGYREKELKCDLFDAFTVSLSAEAPLAKAGRSAPRLLKFSARVWCRGVAGACSDVTRFEIRWPVATTPPGMPGIGSVRLEIGRADS